MTKKPVESVSDSVYSDEEQEEEEEDSDLTEVTESISVDTTIHSKMSQHNFKATSRRVEFGLNEEEKAEKCQTKDHMSRLTYYLNQIDKAFEDIFTAIDVNKHYQPKDIIEEERAIKRVKDFNCRLGRILYQSRQNFTSMNNMSLKSGFAGKTVPNIEDKLAQLYVCVKNMLTSYLHFIPLSGGQLFPGIITDVLEVILDIGNLTASLGFSTNNLPKHVRKLEELSSKQRDTVNVDILNQLARNTFGKSKKQSGEKKRAFAKQPQKQSVIKPKPTKIFQARTNLARMRRMDSIFENDSKNTVSEISTYSLEKQNKQMNRILDEVDKVRVTKKPKKNELEVLKNRLHNLELLAASNNELESISTNCQPATANFQIDLKGDEIKYLINRLEVIESDFDVIAAKYDLNTQHKFLPFKSKYSIRGQNSFENFIPRQEDQDRRDGAYSRSIVKGVVNKITDEILASDLTNIPENI